MGIVVSSVKEKAGKGVQHQIWFDDGDLQYYNLQRGQGKDIIRRGGWCCPSPYPSFPLSPFPSFPLSFSSFSSLSPSLPLTCLLQLRYPSLPHSHLCCVGSLKFRLLGFVHKLTEVTNVKAEHKVSEEQKDELMEKFRKIPDAIIGWRIEVPHEGRTACGTVISLKREKGLTGAETITFLVRFEGGQQAYVPLYRGKGRGLFPKRKGNVPFTLLGYDATVRAVKPAVKVVDLSADEVSSEVNE